MQTPASPCFRLFLGPSAHSPFQLTRRQTALRVVCPELASLESAYIYLVWCAQPLMALDESRLATVLDAQSLSLPAARPDTVYVLPRQ